MEVNCFHQRLFSKDSRFLLVIAHPVDEALYFSPFLLTCKAIRCQVFILCLSEGNFEGYGKIRRKEIRQSAAIYGIDSSQVQVINDINLQDGPNNYWSPENVSTYVTKAVDYLKPTTVITFDECGISGNKNHIDTSRGVKYALSQRMKRSGCGTTQHTEGVTHANSIVSPICLLLESTNTIRKFSGIFDIFCSSVFFERLVLSLNVLTVLVALFMHTSQLVWYRLLLAIFSRYTYINTFKNYSYSGSNRNSNNNNITSNFVLNNS